MLLVLNLPLIGMWVRLLMIPYRLLYPGILVFIAIGAFSLNNSAFDVVLAGILGMLGYVFFKLHCEPAPLLLGFILGPLLEENLRRSMGSFRGDPTGFLRRPISLVMLILVLILLFLMIVPKVQRKREEIFKE